MAKSIRNAALEKSTETLSKDNGVGTQQEETLSSTGVPGKPEDTPSAEIRNERHGGDVPDNLCGWLWKKAGGRDTASISTIIGGRNWQRRWFVLEEGVLSYYTDHLADYKCTLGIEVTTAYKFTEDRGHKKFTPGQGKPIWTGDLKQAKLKDDGSVHCELGFNDTPQVLNATSSVTTPLPSRRR